MIARSYGTVRNYSSIVVIRPDYKGKDSACSYNGNGRQEILLKLIVFNHQIF